MIKTLVVLAAGMGSRYGGLKQLEAVGSQGETILDFTVYDAIQCGFEHAVFVIRREMEQEFRENIMGSWGNCLRVDYVIQELGDLPNGHRPLGTRTKPWGTAHAVWATRQVVQNPFAVVNADDLYGRKALRALGAMLASLSPREPGACMVAYPLSNTLSKHGAVSRGICTLENKTLLEIVERTHIVHDLAGYGYLDGGQRYPLQGDEIVSMNLMGFTPAVFPVIEKELCRFLEKNGDSLKEEIYIPDMLRSLIHLGVSVPVSLTDELWLGVTYPQDKSTVQAGIQDLINGGLYPSPLWPQ